MSALDLIAPSQEKLLWNVREAGAALSISPWTVRLYIRQRKLWPVRVGRRILLEPEECRRFLDTCKHPQMQKGEATKSTRQKQSDRPSMHRAGGQLVSYG
jgi:hypothetical protein